MWIAHQKGIQLLQPLNLVISPVPAVESANAMRSLDHQIPAMYSAKLEAIKLMALAAVKVKTNNNMVILTAVITVLVQAHQVHPKGMANLNKEEHKAQQKVCHQPETTRVKLLPHPKED